MNNGDATLQSEEAKTILKEIIDHLTSPSYDLISIFRKCQHVCEILSWSDQYKWFHNELNGYPQSFSPFYRFISGKKIWNNLANGIARSTFSEEMVYGRDKTIYKEEPDSLELFSGINWIINAATNGYSENTEITKLAPSPSGKKNITLTQVRVFPSQSFQQVIKIIEGLAFDFASKAYVQLQYSESVTNVWDHYRLLVDSKLSQYDFKDHLQTINKNIQSTNPEDWRVAVFGCRNLLHDIADYLWKDNRSTYTLLEGDGEKGKLEVIKEKFGNRIAAYIHQKNISGTKGKFFRNEAERMAESIQAIIAFQSEAHDQMEIIDAQSVVINTYILIGELLIRTDFEPIIEYQKK